MKKILLASIGTRGDVQPILALAVELKALGQQPILCVAPNFKEWVESYGVPCVALGPDLRKFIAQRKGKMKIKVNRKAARAMVDHSTRDQFKVVGEAARDCGLIVVGGMLLTAGRSIAEALEIPYVYASYCALTLPSPDHPPPPMSQRNRARITNRLLWRFYEFGWNKLFGPTLNKEREALGLPPVKNVPRYVSTDRPLLAADAALGPAGRPIGMTVEQTGAWFLRDSTPLPSELEDFLNAGEPPIYFGFGSMGAVAETGDRLIAAARALKRRAIVLRGWGGLKASDLRDDCIEIDDVAHERLLPRVAAVVHHGGAGTTTAAARAGVPQVVVPHSYDQYYWAQRITTLGIGGRCRDADELSSEEVTDALRVCLQSDTQRRAKELATRMELYGARKTAERMVRELC